MTTLVQLYYDGDWHDVPVYSRDPVTTLRGLADTTFEPTPGTATATARNVDGTYNPENPMSSLYGKIGRNTPMRVLDGGVVRWSGEAASYEPDRSIRPPSTTTGDAWSVVTGAGVLQRLGRGKTPLKTPLSRAILASGPVDYWPLTDGTGSTQLASAVGRPPLTVVDAPILADIEGPAGAPGKLLTVRKDLALIGEAVANPITMPDTGTWSLEFWVRAEIDATLTHPQAGIMSFTTPAGTYKQWFIEIFDAESIYGSGYAGQLVVELWCLYTDTTSTGTKCFFANDNNWHSVQCTAYNDGSDFTIVVTGDNDDTGVNTSLPAGTVGTITSLELGTRPFGPYLDYNNAGRITIGHLALYDYFVFGHYPAGTGYVGETAGARFTRITAEEGISSSILGTSAETTPMGPQQSATTLDLLKECARTDAGYLFEARQSNDLVLRTRRDMIDQTPVLTLDFTELTPPFKPVINDLQSRNDITANSPLSSANRVLESGPLSILDPPDGIGRTETKIEVNPAGDAALYSCASWSLNLGTIGGIRYAAINVDPDVIAADVSTLEIGDRVIVEGLPLLDNPNDADLLIVQIGETFDAVRKLRLVTVPAAVYNGVRTYGQTSARYDVAGSTIAACSSTATTMYVSPTAWSTSATPYDWSVAGERVTVTAITGASPQVATVTRSVNGVVKSHADGTEVRLFDPTRWDKA
jgi:hypothetical protein